jgi:transposase
MIDHRASDPSMPQSWVGIDIAKDLHVVLVVTPTERRQFKVPNTLEAVQRFLAYLGGLPTPVRIGLEPTGDYHRPLAYRLVAAGFDVVSISSLTAARYREARYTSWDKNDAKDAGIIVELLQQGLTMRYVDPVHSGWNDVQEVAKTYWQVTLARTRVQHSLLTHFLPLYWPEFARYWHTTRGQAFIAMLLAYPLPALIAALPIEAFVAAAWDAPGRKVAKRAWLEGVHTLAQRSLGIPIAPDSAAVQSFRLRLQAYLDLTRQRAQLEAWAADLLHHVPDFHALQTIPGIGPVFALTILAEAGDLRRFRHHRQFLKFCGLDLAKAQSGTQRGHETLSKRGNGRLRCAFWFAGRIAVRMRECSIRDKYERYLATGPATADRKRKAYTAIAAKMARIAHGVIKTGRPYAGYHEHDLPSGSIPLSGAVEAVTPS